MMNGPIHNFSHFLRECQRRVFSIKNVFQGMERILYGYVKIIFIGNYLLNYGLSFWITSFLKNEGMISGFLNSMNSWLILYAVFSGYTDVALGFSKIWGIKLEENFYHPLWAKNLIEFWQRWHITLSKWCKDYIYLPISAYSRSHVLAVFAAMIAIGLWHQLSLYYFLWALYQGTGLIICRVYQTSKDPFKLKKLPLLIQNTIFRCLTWGWLISAKPLITHFIR